MRFKSLRIKNFRNFREVNIKISNRNIIFGRNDFGKTNFLHAIRYLFDYRLRNKGFEIYDYFERNTSKPIEITLEIQLDENDHDSNNLRSKMRGATSFAKNNIVYIQLRSEFNEEEKFGNIELFWGGILYELEKIPQRGNYYDLDKIFEAVYIDSFVDPMKLYSSNRSLLYKGVETDNDKDIQEAIKKLNKAISDDYRVKKISDTLTDKYKDIRDERLKILLKSELEINGTFNHLIPYISRLGDEENLYPTSGDGRKKILAYALINYVHDLKQENESGKIYIYLIEEIENSLHPTMQKAISRHLFEKKNGYPYIFMTTHAAEMLFYINDVRLIRIYQKQQDITSETIFYQVPSKYHKTKKTFNRLLAQALFADHVLLVEGPSEQILFEAVLDTLAKHESCGVNYYLLEGIQILNVNGIGFEKYVNILRKLHIYPVVKTDNDIQKVRGKNELLPLGFNRCLNLAEIPDREYKYDKNKQGNYVINNISIEEEWDEKNIALKNKYKTKLYTKNRKLYSQFRCQNIYLSKIELEEDLVEAIRLHPSLNREEDFERYFGKKPSDFVKYLQQAKMNHMNAFVNSEWFNLELCKVIYSHTNFSCLKALLGVDFNVC